MHNFYFYILQTLTGLFTWFVTISPDDVHHTLSIRMNHVERYDEKDKQGKKFVREISLGQHGYDLYKEATENPVTCATMFNRSMENIISLLIQSPLSHLHKKTLLPLSTRQKGVFGVAIASQFVVENNGRESFHAHGLVYTPIAPSTLEYISEHPALVKHVADVIDVMVKGEVDVEVREKIHALRKQATNATDETEVLQAKKQLLRKYRAFNEIDINMCYTCGQENAFFTNNHVHTFTCCKGKTGKFKCRLCKPSGTTYEGTGPTALEPTCHGDDVIVAARIEGPIREKTVFFDYGDFDQPLPPPDDRCLVWEIKRGLIIPKGQEFNRAAYAPSTNFLTVEDFTLGTEANGYISDFNPVLQTILNCNTAIYFLGTLEQAKGIAMYLVKYLIKEGNSVESVAAVAWAAQHKCAQHPSTAADAGEYERNAIYFYQKFLLGYSSGYEIGANKAAAICLNQPASYRSHPTSFLFLPPGLSHVEGTFSEPAEENSEGGRGEGGEEDDVEFETNTTTVRPDDPWNAMMTRARARDDSSSDVTAYESSDDGIKEPDLYDTSLDAILPGIDFSKDEDYVEPDNDDVKDNVDDDMAQEDSQEIIKLTSLFNAVSQLSEISQISHAKMNVDDDRSSGVYSVDTQISSTPPTVRKEKHVDFMEDKTGADQVGCATIVVDENNKIQCIQQHNNYGYRGGQLHFLCWYEYVGTIVIVDHPDEKEKKKKEKALKKKMEDENNNMDMHEQDGDEESKEKHQDASDDDKDKDVEEEEIVYPVEDTDQSASDSKIRRKSSAVYHFDPLHAEQSIKTQRVRSKFMVPIVTGPRVKLPKNIFRGDGKTINSAANLFARQILIMFKPWSLTLFRPEGDLGWYGFCKFMKELSRPDAGYMAHAKLEVIQNMARGLKPNKKFHSLMTNWRYRNVLSWEQLRNMKGSNVPDAKYFNDAVGGGGGTKENTFVVTEDEITMIQKLEQLSGAIFRGLATINPFAKGNAQLEAQSYCNQTNDDLARIFNPDGYARPEAISATLGGVDDSPQCHYLKDESTEPISEEMRVESFSSRLPCVFPLTKFTSFGQNALSKCEDVLSKLQTSKKSRMVLSNQPHIERICARRLGDSTRPPCLQPCADIEAFQTMHRFRLLIDPCFPKRKQVEFLFCKVEHFKKRLEYAVYKTVEDPGLLFICLLGAPGTGKSTVLREYVFITDVITSQCAIGIRLVFVTSTTGVSAANLKLNAPTTHSGVHVYSQDQRQRKEIVAFTTKREENTFFPKLNRDQLAEMRSLHGCDGKSDNAMNTTIELIGDECSNEGPIFLGQTLQRLKEIFPNTTSLAGGRDVTLIGDFEQNGPVGETALYQSMTELGLEYFKKYPANSPAFQGADFMIKHFKFISLDEQVRAPDDPRHQAFIEQLRNPNVKYPIDDAFIDDLKQKQLRPCDRENFADVPVAVTSNYEIFRCSLSRLVSTAQKHGVCVIAYRSTLQKKHYEAININGKVSVDSFFNQYRDTKLWQYFTPGHPVLAYLTNNICPAKGLANGSPCYLNHLVFKTEREAQFVETLVRKAKPGEVIYLNDIKPVYVVVKVEKITVAPDIHTVLVDPASAGLGLKTRQQRPSRRATSMESIGQDALGVSPRAEGMQTRSKVQGVNKPSRLPPPPPPPVPPAPAPVPAFVEDETSNVDDDRDSDCLDDSKDRQFSYIPLKTFYNVFSVRLSGDTKIQVHAFPYEDSFVRTIHKFQSCTMEQMILALNQRPGSRGGLLSLTLANLQVAYTRVRDSDNMKIMPLFNDNSLDYLKGLKRNVYLNIFYRGIQADGSWILPTNASSLIAEDKNKKGQKNVKRNVRFNEKPQLKGKKQQGPSKPNLKRKEGYSCLLTSMQKDALNSLAHQKLSSDDIIVKFLEIFHWAPPDLLPYVTNLLTAGQSSLFAPVIRAPVILSYDQIQTLKDEEIYETFALNTRGMIQVTNDFRLKNFLARYNTLIDTLIFMKQYITNSCFFFTE